LSPTSLIAVAITQLIAVAIAVAIAIAIALVAVARLSPSSSLPLLASLLINPFPTTNTVFWLVVAFFNYWQPPKAWALPISLFLDGSRFGAPSKGTSRVDRKPANGRLQQTHGESRRHDLGQWRMLPWQYGAKMLGVGRRWLILFFFCVGTQHPWKNPSRLEMLLSYVDLYPLWVTFLCGLWVLGVLLCTIKNITKYLTCAKTFYTFLWCAGISGTFCVILVTFPR
jgi:hypothetical protein